MSREHQQLILVVQNCRTNIAALESGMHKGIITEENILTLLKDYRLLLEITEEQLKREKT